MPSSYYKKLLERRKAEPPQVACTGPFKDGSKFEDIFQRTSTKGREVTTPVSPNRQIPCSASSPFEDASKFEDLFLRTSIERRDLTSPVSPKSQMPLREK